MTTKNTKDIKAKDTKGAAKAKTETGTPKTECRGECPQFIETDAAWIRTHLQSSGEKPLSQMTLGEIRETFVEGFKRNRNVLLCVLLGLFVAWAVRDTFMQQQAKIDNLGQKISLLQKEVATSKNKEKTEQDTCKTGNCTRPAVKKAPEAQTKTPPAGVQKAEKSVPGPIEKKTAAPKLPTLPGVSKVVELDTKKVRAFKDDKDRVLYMIDNGRFVLVGDMIDVWNKKKLDTLEEVDAAFNRVDLKAAGFNINDTNHFSIGQGSKHVTVFADPTCPWCKSFLKEARDSRELMENYTFDFVLIGLLGEPGREATKNLLCSNAPGLAKANAVLAGPDAIRGLAKSGQCDEEKIRKTEMISGALGVRSVPYIVADDGRFHKGKPRDIKAWLDGKAQPAQPTPPVKAQEREEVDAKPLAKVNKQTLNLMSAGSGAKHITVFVDPQCGWCHKSVEEILGDKEILEKFTFDFVATSILGPNSEKYNKILACEKDPVKRLKAFTAGAKEIVKLNDGSCAEKLTGATETLRKAMKMRSVPVFVKDGKAATGKPRTIRRYLGLTDAARPSLMKGTPVIDVKKGEDGRMHAYPRK